MRKNKILSNLSSYLDGSPFVITLICLMILNSFISSRLKYRTLISIIFEIIIFFLLICFISRNKNDLNHYNLSELSIRLLFLIPFSAFFQMYSGILSLFLFVVYSTISQFFIKKIIKEDWTIITKTKPSQFYFLLIGFLIGFGISLFKTVRIEPNIFTLFQNSPGQIIYSIFASLIGTALYEEFIFRGIFWGYLRSKNISENIAIVITTIIWSISHVNYYENPVSMMNVVFLGVILGLLVKYFKSLDVSIGAHAGFNALILFRLILSL